MAGVLASPRLEELRAVGAGDDLAPGHHLLAHRAAVQSQHADGLVVDGDDSGEQVHAGTQVCAVLVAGHLQQETRAGVFGVVGAERPRHVRLREDRVDPGSESVIFAQVCGVGITPPFDLLELAHASALATSPCGSTGSTPRPFRAAITAAGWSRQCCSIIWLPARSSRQRKSGPALLAVSAHESSRL